MQEIIFSNIKKSGNPLFKLNKLSLHEQVENLKVLFGNKNETITANVEDLRSALDKISKRDSVDNSQELVSCEEDSVHIMEDNLVATIQDNTEDLCLDNTPALVAEEKKEYSKDMAIIFKYNDTNLLGIIENVDTEKMLVIPLQSSVKTSTRKRKVGQLWRYPDVIEGIEISRDCILPVWPILELDLLLSSRGRKNRIPRFRLLNDDIVSSLL